MKSGQVWNSVRADTYVSDGKKVPEALAHLLAVNVDEPVMQPVPHKRPSLADPSGGGSMAVMVV